MFVVATVRRRSVVRHAVDVRACLALAAVEHGDEEAEKK
jgi:hypothetical protein